MTASFETRVELFRAICERADALLIHANRTLRTDDFPAVIDEAERRMKRESALCQMMCERLAVTR